MTTRLRLHACFLIAITLLYSASTVNADLIPNESILLDFGNTEVPNTNHIGGSGTSTGLATLDSLRTTTVSVDFVGTGGVFANDGSGPGTAAIPSPFTSDILNDWAGIGSSGSLDVQFSGLNPSLTYDVTYALGGFTDGAGQTSDIVLSVDGQSQSLGENSADGRYVTFTGLSTDSSGGLLFEVDPPAGVTGAGVRGSVPVISGLLLSANGVSVAVPEPSSLALLGLGGLGMLMRRRK